MPKIVLPNGNTITYTGGLAEKLRVLDAAGIEYVPTTEEIEADAQQAASKQIIVDEYSSALSTLQIIEDAQVPTNAQVVAAVKFLARTMRLLLRFLYRYLID